MGINEKAGEVFSVAAENSPVAGCTVSKAVAEVAGGYVAHFSLAAGTDISPESYPNAKLWIVADGTMEVVGDQFQTGFTRLAGLSEHLNPVNPVNPVQNKTLGKGDVFITPVETPVGVKSEKGAVYTEIEFGKETKMNKILEAGKAFAMKDVLPYADGRIVNMDLASSPNMKFVLMSFDAGTGLSEHSAPGDALIFALDGEATIGYEGAEHVIKAGENFKFAKNGRHWVKANGRFKMALLLVID